MISQRKKSSCDYFSQEYSEARVKLLDFAAKAGASSMSFRVNGAGPFGEELYIDCVRLGPESSKSKMVLLSGLHGVEGYCGSAVQVAFLNQYIEHRCLTMNNISCLLVHAINPFGMAWKRRVNGAGVDLNRNAIFNRDWPRFGPPPYLDRVLNPRILETSDSYFWAQAIYAIARNGFKAIKSAIAGGQYVNPKGLFFGGFSPEPETRLISDFLSNEIKTADQCVLLDFHSGAGPVGRPALYALGAPTKNDRKGLKKILGIEPKAAHGGDTKLYSVTGSLLTFLKDQVFDHPRFFCATYEYGGCTPFKTIRALRNENWAYQQLGQKNQVYLSARQELEKCFAPKSEAWRNGYVRGAMKIVNSALGYLCKNTIRAATSTAREGTL